MKICLIMEGSYPYVPGGVSTWAHDLISGMPEHQFVILSIMPSSEDSKEYHYDLPTNVVEIRTVHLEDYLQVPPDTRPREPRFDSRERQAVRQFLRFDRHVDFETVLKAIGDRERAGTISQFFKSRFFWQSLVDQYETHYSREEFNPFFWTLRSMYMPLVHLMQHPSLEADVYHAVSTGYAGLLAMVGKFTYRKPMVLTEHGIYAREREEEILQAKWVTGVYKRFWIDLFYFLSVGAYRHADLVLSLFERNRQIQLELGADQEKTWVVSNGVDFERFDRLLEEHEGFHVGAVLRVVPIKDVKTLLKAFRLLKNMVPDARLSVVGPYDEDPEYFRECRNMVERLGLSEAVVFTGRQDVVKMMPTMDVMVLSSLSEGQPLVMLEGFAMRIPFVVTDVGACRELIEGKDDGIGHAGRVVTPVSPYELFEALLELHQDPALRRQMGHNGRRRVEKDYTHTQWLAQYRGIYQLMER